MLTLFSVWPADILVIALASDQEATCWIPEPLHMWRCIEEGNVATSVVLDNILDLQDVMLPVPPLDHDFISPSSPPPPYEQAVPSTQLFDTIEIISDDEGDGNDNDDCIFVN